MILAQSYHIFTDGFWGYLQSKKSTHSVNNIGLRDASASKNPSCMNMTIVNLDRNSTFLKEGKWENTFVEDSDKSQNVHEAK